MQAIDISSKHRMSQALYNTQYLSSERPQYLSNRKYLDDRIRNWLPLNEVHNLENPHTSCKSHHMAEV